MKFFILFSLLGLSLGITHNRFNKAALANRGIIKPEDKVLENLNKMVSISPEIEERVPDGTGKTKKILEDSEEELLPNEEKLRREIDERIQPIFDTLLLRSKEIINDNHDFLSNLFKKFEAVLRSLNAKERRGIWGSIFNTITDSFVKVLKNDTAV